MLLGPSLKGKTITINMVYDELVDNKYKFIDTKAKVICDKIQLGDEPYDFASILKYNNKRIALFSMGDICWCLIHAMSFFYDIKCDVFICACNDKFKEPLKRLREWYGEEPLIKTIVETGLKEDEDIANIKDMNEIIGRINL
jgi:hypothetical protein